MKKANKFLAALLTLALVAPWGMWSAAFADYELVNSNRTAPAHQETQRGAGTVKPAPSEGEFLTLLDRGLGGKKAPVDYRGRIQLRAGFGYWEDDSHGTWQYQELVANVLGKGRHVWGFTAKHETYKGTKPETPEFRFDGEGLYFGPSYEYRNFSVDRWGFNGLNIGGTAGYELFKSNGSKVGYFKGEEADVLAGKLYAYLYRAGFIQMISLESVFRFDQGSLIARNSWEDDRPGNRTSRELKLRAHTRRLLGDSVSFNAGVKASYEADRQFLQTGPAAGITIWDAIYIDGEYLHGTSEAPDKWGVGMSVDLYNVGRGVVRTVRRWFGSKDTKPVENDWQVVR